MKVDIKAIRPPKFKFRDDIGNLEELKESMKDIGLQVPIIVREKNGKYEIVAGHRRWLSALELGWTEISVDNRGDLTDKDSFEIALVENLLRRELDPIEEAKAYKRYIVENGYGSAKELAGKVGKTSAYISDRLSLLDLPEEIMDKVEKGTITPSHGEELAKLDTDKASKLADIVVSSSLTRDQTQRAVGWVKAGAEPEQAVHKALAFPDLAPPKEVNKYDVIEDARNNVVLTLQKALKDLDFNINTLPEGPEQGMWIREIRYPLHELINKALGIHQKYRKEDD